MLKKVILAGSLVLATIFANAQVGIGTTDPKSSLEIQGSLGFKVNTITSATTLDDTYHVVLCNNGPYTVTLPPAAANTGRVYRIKNIDAQSDVITIDGNGSETIDGALTYALQPYQYSITLISDGANWQVIEFFTSGVSPTASAGAALSAICQSETSAAMGGSVGGSATGGTWTGGAGIWTNATNPSTATYTAGASESGSITLTLTTSGGSFGTTTATKSITVNATNSAGAASSTPTLCINTALTNITHTTTGATGIGAATGLPAGVTAAWASNTITISGTPTASGTFNYSIPLTGGCGSVNATGTITVTAANTAGAASSTPTLCINTALTNITHTTTGATGIGAATGLPAGVTAAWASNTITISGTPTANGTFNYSIPLTGGCGTVNATGTITVTAANTAGAASSTPTLCINTALTNITHTTTGATGIGTATGLPAGVTAAWASNTITISGTPTANGTFNYSIPLTGGCGSVNATGTITVTAANTAGAASSTPTLVENTALTAITHTTTGATGIGAATGLPAGVTAAWASNTITISGTPTATGTFNYSIPLTGGCGSVNATGTITVTAAGGSIPGNATCTGATISATPCSSVSGATINDNGTTTLGTEYDWTGATTSGMANTSTTQAIVDIGGQCWMRYNMNVTPSNFNPAPTWVNSTDVGWSGVYTGGPYTDEGLLYQWSAAMNNSTTERAQGICPSGWHIPSDCEWMYLENTLGMSTAEQQATGNRTTGTVGTDLSTLSSSGTNSSGFTALLTGSRAPWGAYVGRNANGVWWSSTQSTSNAFYRQIRNYHTGVERGATSSADTFPIRCIKD